MSSFSKIIVRYIVGVSELLFPKLCGVCEEPLQRGERVICTPCRWNMPLTYYWDLEDNFALELLAGRFPLSHACSLMFFENYDHYRLMIHRMKYGSRVDIAGATGAVLGGFLTESAFYQDVDLVVAVPLHWTKRIKRGYNQSEELAKALAKEMGVRYDFSILKRTRATSVQARKRSREERSRNVSNAFEVQHHDRLEGRHVLLVDDVLTTGATVEACALAMIAACPDLRISVATLAVVKKYIPH